MSRPWMPWYVADFVADTLHLSAAQTGAYMLLIGHYWQHGSLPEDESALARVARMTAAEWRRSQPAIAAFFHDGWKHKRIDAELARAADISSKRAASAKQKHSNSSANAEQMDTHARASPPSQPHPQEKTPSLRSGGRTRACALPADWVPDREFARLKGLAEARIDEEISRFRDHAAAKGRTAKDWAAAWRNWITSPYQARGSPVNGHSAPRPGSKEDMRERTADAYQKLSNYVDAHADDEGGSGRAGEADVGLIPIAQSPRS